MNRKKIKQKLRSEILSVTPDVHDEVVNLSYIEKPRTTAEERGAGRIDYKKVLPAVIAACLIIAVTVTCGVLFGGKKDPVITPYSTYMTVEILDCSASASASGGNYPSVSLTADSAGKIDSVRANNESGRNILCGIGVSLIGEDIFEGVGAIAAFSAKMGYIDVTATAATATRYVSVTTGGDGKISRINSGIEQTLAAYFKSNGIFAAVKTAEYGIEDILNIVSKVDKNAVLSDGIVAMNAVLADREESYVYDVYSDESKGKSEAAAIFGVYAEVLISNLDELIEILSVNPLYSELVKKLTYIRDNTALGAARIGGYIDTFTTISAVLLPEDIKKELDSYIVSVPDTVTKLGEFIVNVAARHAGELQEKYGGAYIETRAEISDGEYAEFSAKFN